MKKMIFVLFLSITFFGVQCLYASREKQWYEQSLEQLTQQLEEQVPNANQNPGVEPAAQAYQGYPDEPELDEDDTEGIGPRTLNFDNC